MNQSIDVLASYSTDSLLDATGALFATQPGGPALFIERVLKTERLPYEIRSGDPIGVEILVNERGEFGRVTQAPHKQQTSPVLSDWTIVSTLLDEWALKEPLPSKLFVDLQGYVRDGTDFGKKQPSRNVNRLAGEIFCLKGTAEEVSYLSKAALERQKKNLLIVTNGSRGVSLYYQGQYEYLPVKQIENLADTIGAGDTFFAYFVASMFRGNPPLEAAKYAIKQTGEFLKVKSVTRSSL